MRKTRMQATGFFAFHHGNHHSASTTKPRSVASSYRSGDNSMTKSPFFLQPGPCRNSRSSLIEPKPRARVRDDAPTRGIGANQDLMHFLTSTLIAANQPGDYFSSTELVLSGQIVNREKLYPNVQQRMDCAARTDHVRTHLQNSGGTRNSYTVNTKTV